MNDIFDEFWPPEEDLDINVDDLDSFEEINSVYLSDDCGDDDHDDAETEVFDTSSHGSIHEHDSTTHVPKKLKLPQPTTDSHLFVEKNTGYEFVFSNSQVANFMFFIGSKFSCHVVK